MIYVSQFGSRIKRILSKSSFLSPNLLQSLFGTISTIFTVSLGKMEQHPVSIPIYSISLRNIEEWFTGALFSKDILLHVIRNSQRNEVTSCLSFFIICRNINFCFGYLTLFQEHQPFYSLQITQLCKRMYSSIHNLLFRCSGLLFTSLGICRSRRCNIGAPKQV